MASLARGCGASYSSPYPLTRGLAVLGWKVHSRRSRSSSSARSWATLREAFSAEASSSTVLGCKAEEHALLGSIKFRQSGALHPNGVTHDVPACPAQLPPK